MRNWNRRTRVTGGADPTVTVTWSLGDMYDITEFQGVYMVNAATSGERVATPLEQDLHEALESFYQCELIKNTLLGE